ncbi:MAG TPA: general stress protein CsbD [Burkholderiales bacterium]|nr:general stress protein CsbD [Burkholderiales bacterium]
MDWTVIETRWYEFKASAKREWDKLSEDQLSGTRGNRGYLSKRVQEAYGVSAEEAERQVAGWQDKQYDRQARSANGP